MEKHKRIWLPGTFSCDVLKYDPDLRCGKTRNAVSNHLKLIAFDRDAGQPAGSISAGIDIDPVGVDFHLDDGCMAVHHDLAETRRAEQKFLADLQQVTITLLVERHAGTDSGVYEEEVAADEAVGQASQKIQMPVPIHRERQRHREQLLRRRVERIVGGESIGPQRFQSTEAQPVGKRYGVVEKVEHVSLVIAPQTYGILAAVAQDEGVEHLSRRGAPVDIIADKDNKRPGDRIGRNVRLDAIKQRLQQIVASMDVADGVDSDAVRKPAGQGNREGCIIRRPERFTRHTHSPALNTIAGLSILALRSRSL
jgi:hypothetical protein